jgi:hypothetical protein
MKTIIAILILAVGAAAQTLSPIRVECGKRCSGQFTVTNGSIEPMTVVVQPFSAAVTPEGKAKLRPLDAGVDVRMPEMSARIGPHDDHTFDYTLKCATLPCMTQLLVSMTAGHTVSGMAIRVLIPETIYACEKSKDCRKKTFLAAGVKE